MRHNNCHSSSSTQLSSLSSSEDTPFRIFANQCNCASSTSLHCIANDAPANRKAPLTIRHNDLDYSTASSSLISSHYCRPHLPSIITTSLLFFFFPLLKFICKFFFHPLKI